MDAALSDTLAANSELHLKNAVVTTKTTEVEGTLVLENSTLNTDFFLGGGPDEIKIVKSRINNPLMPMENLLKRTTIALLKIGKRMLLN